jgi:hypothetical protein
MGRTANVVLTPASLVADASLPSNENGAPLEGKGPVRVGMAHAAGSVTVTVVLLITSLPAATVV